MKKLSLLLIAVFIIALNSCSDDSSSPSKGVDDTYVLKGTVTLAPGVEKTDLAHVYCVWKSPMSGMYIEGKSPINWDKMTFSITLKTPLNEQCYFQEDFAFAYIMVFPNAGYAADINEKIANDNLIGISEDNHMLLIEDTDNEIIQRDLPNADKGFMTVKASVDESGAVSFTENNSDINVTITK